MRAPLGIYVHFPWCVRRCPYCDFNVHRGGEIPHEAYRDAVLAELEARAGAFTGPSLSVYFGGGSPGLWRPGCVAAIVDAAAARLGLTADAEITVECNPEDVTAAHLEALHAVGVNRLSLGTQSFDDDTLHALGRRHDAAQNRAAVALARAAGFEDVSLDLIHGLHGQGLEGAVADVRAACALEPTHVSLYELTIAEGTPFGRRAEAGLPVQAPDDVRAAMYEGTRQALVAHGFVPYEISNAARPGFEARHNRLYWEMAPYVGLGAGAHGFERTGRQGRRYANLADPAAYMAVPRGRAPEAESDPVDAAAFEDELVMTGLRLDMGVRLTAAQSARLAPRLETLAAEGLLARRAGRWRVTARGRPVLDHVILRLLAEPS